jgi:hypothetical protein
MFDTKYGNIPHPKVFVNKPAIKPNILIVTNNINKGARKKDDATVALNLKNKYNTFIIATMVVFIALCGVNNK